MAAYPTLPTLNESRAERQSGIVARRATNGALKMRADWPADKTTFQLAHRLTPAEWSTLTAFYALNRLLDLDYTWPGDSATYTVRFAAPPQAQRIGGYLDVRVSLLEV